MEKKDYLRLCGLVGIILGQLAYCITTEKSGMQFFITSIIIIAIYLIIFRHKEN